MKVMLCVPTHEYKRYPIFLSISDFPSGFGYLASALKQAGHEVIGLNLNNITGYPTGYQMIYDQIRKKLKEVEPDLIGTGGIVTDYPFLRDAIEIIRKYSKAPIVLGGGIVNNDAEFIFNLLKPDYAIVGEGEETMVRLANSLQELKVPPQESGTIPTSVSTVDGSKGFMGNAVQFIAGDLSKIPNLWYWREE